MVLSLSVKYGLITPFRFPYPAPKRGFDLGDGFGGDADALGVEQRLTPDALQLGQADHARTVRRTRVDRRLTNTESRKALL